MFTKILVVLALACVALGKEYPPGVSGAVCPDFPVCDAGMLARFTLDGQPIPEWMYNPSILPVGPADDRLIFRLARFGSLYPVVV